jgi:hypothetical protein
MTSTNLIARTVSIVKPYREETRNGNNGTFTAKEIFFKVAVDRDYKVTRQENGKTISEYPTDFFLVKATGGLAETINKYATAVKEDGKLQSRLIALGGNFETYRKDREVDIDKVYQVNVNGVLYSIPVKDKITVPDTPVIFVADSIRFLDKNPNAGQAQQAQASAPVIMSATPVAQVAPAQVPAQATAPVAQAPVQVVAPTVAPAFDANSAECPY